MKKNRIKVFVVVLFVLMLVLGIRSFKVTKDILDNGLSVDIAFVDRFTVFASFLLNILIAGIFLILIFRILADLQRASSNDNDNTTLLKKEKRRKKAQKEVANENTLEEKQVIEKLNFELDKISDIELFTEKVLINISKVYDIMQGIFFVKDKMDSVFRKKGAYAYYSEEELREFTEEVGLSGQVAANKKLLNISNIPEKYITVLSGLGKSSPANLLILPIIYKNESIGIVELASFKKFDSFAEKILTGFGSQIAEQLAKYSLAQESATK